MTEADILARKIAREDAVPDWDALPLFLQAEYMKQAASEINGCGETHNVSALEKQRREIWP